MAKGHLGIRAEQDTLERLDVAAAELSAKASGAIVTRSDAARIALERGLADLERELGLAKKGPTKPAGKPKK